MIVGQSLGTVQVRELVVIRLSILPDEGATGNYEQQDLSHDW
jgi:hypothetical protein